MGLDLNTALISDTFDGLIKTQDGNVLTATPTPIGDGRGNDSSLGLATAGNGVTITGTLLVDGANIGTGLSTAQADIIAIEAKTDFITVTGAINLDTIKTKADFITVTQAVDLDAMEVKTNFITITQAVNLDTVESNAAAAKAKTDYLTVTQAVDLDTLESDMVVAKADITAIEAKTDYITISSALNLNTVASNASDAKAKTDFITITQAVNLDTVESGLAQAQTDINQIEGKTDFITVTQAVNLDTMESDIATNNAKNSYPAGDATKVGFISVTQAVDLDSMETDISNLSSNKYDKTGGTISGSVTVTGDLTVNGTTTTVNTETLSVKDPLIELANQNSANSVDTGFYANYSLDAGVTTKYAGLFKDAGDSDKFKLFKGLEVEPTTTVDTAGTGYTKGDLVVGDLDAVTISGDFTGNVTATSVLANGVTATTQSAGDNSTKVATTAYVDSIVTAQDLDFAGGTGTGSVDLDSQTFTIAGTANEIETSASGQTITIGLPSSVTVGTLNATTLAGTLSTAAQPNITSVGTLSSLAVSGDLTVDTSTLKVDSANNRVGIGTASPSSDLEVIGISKFTRSGKSVIINPNFGSANLYAQIDSDSGMGLAFAPNNGVEAMRIDSSGNVLVGDSTYAGFGQLQIGNASTTTTRIQMIASPTTGSGGIHFGDTTSATNGRFAGFLLYDHNGDYMRLGTSETERLRIDSSGRVGIATNNPRLSLEVIGTDAAESGTATPNGAIMVGNPTAANSQFLTIGTVNGAGNYSWIQSRNSTQALFYNLVLNPSGGNVGIGCTPANKLTVRAATNDNLDIYSSSGVGIQAVNDANTAYRPMIFNASSYSFNSGNVSLPNGNGIDFSASAGGGATSSLLDDYEEGTWTMGISFGGNAVGVTYLANTGTYTKIGRQVTATGYLIIDNKGSSTGTLKITGLPYTIGAPPSFYPAASVGYFTGISFADTLTAFGDINSTNIAVYETTNAGVATVITDANFVTANYQIIITITYFTP